MSTLTYKGQYWIGESDTLLVRMDDATYRRHLNAYLESMGVPTQTYLQLMEHVQAVCEQQYQAAHILRNLDYWRDCNDPEVRILKK